MKKSFLIHIDSLDVLDHLSDEQCGQLLRAFKSHHLGEKITLCSTVSIAFSPFKNQFSRDLETYENVCNRNRINGMKGGRPITQKTQVVNSITQDNPEKPKQPDSDKDSDSKKDKDSVNQKNRFTPPTLEQIKSYITEQNYPIDSQKFYDHYETANWYRGKTKIKNWKACVRTWLNGNSGKAAYGADSI